MTFRSTVSENLSFRCKLFFNKVVFIGSEIILLVGHKVTEYSAIFIFKELDCCSLEGSVFEVMDHSNVLHIEQGYCN